MLKNQKYFNSYSSGFNFNNNNFETTKQIEQVEYPSPVLEDPFYGLSFQPFDEEVNKILLAPIHPQDIEIKPDGILFLPEIKYRKVLNQAFGPGAWALLPRGPHFFNQDRTTVSRDFSLYIHGNFISQTCGEQDYIDNRSIATTLEAAKSNALMRCCKDLGIASELWDPEFLIDWKVQYAIQVWCERDGKGKKKLWRRKDRPKFTGAWKEVE